MDNLKINNYYFLHIFYCIVFPFVFGFYFISDNLNHNLKFIQLK